MNKKIYDLEKLKFNVYTIYLAYLFPDFAAPSAIFDQYNQ